MKKTVGFLTLLVLSFFSSGGVIVLKNNKVIPCQGEYQILKRQIRFKDMEGAVFLLPLNFVDLDRCSQEDVKQTSEEEARLLAERNRLQKKKSIFQVVDDAGVLTGAKKIALNQSQMNEYSLRRKDRSIGDKSLLEAYLSPHVFMSCIREQDEQCVREALIDGAVVNPVRTSRARMEFDMSSIYMYGGVPLYSAIKTGNYRIIRMLLKAGADPNYVVARTTPLAYALYCRLPNQDEILQLLLENGAVSPDTGGKTKSALHYALIQGNTKLAHLLIQKGSNINREDETGTTPLQLALKRNNIEILKLMYDYGSLNERNGVTGETPVFDAIRFSTFEVVKLLVVDMGVSLNVISDSSETPLMLAVRVGEDEVVDLLVSHGAKADLKTDTGQNAMTMLAKQDELILLKKMLQYCPLTSGNTAELLGMAVEGGANFVVDFLLKNGGDANGTTRNGNPLLATAVKKGEIKVVKQLLDAGASVRAKTHDGESMLNLVPGKNATKIRKLLKAKL